MKTKGKGKSITLFTLCVVGIFFLAFAGFHGLVVGSGSNQWEFKSFEKSITKGLDLQGGVSVLMEIQSDKTVSKDDLNKTKEMLSLRVNKAGVAETVVTTEGNKRIRIDIPGQYDSKSIVDSLSKTGELSFKDPDGNVLLTGKDVKKATSGTDQQTGQIIVSLEFNDAGKKKFADATTKLIGKQISISMDEDVLTSPVVQNAIIDGKAQITGNKTAEEANKIAAIINAGALPMPVKAVSTQTVGAQLGANALPNALKAGAVGICIIFVFMLLYYRGPGLIACLGLTLFISLVLFTFIGVGVTLTLPGIAALLLTIGMAVDANVLMFERIREELRTGKSVKTSVKAGFHNAMSSIIDSNLTTIISSLVLYFLGSGPVKGFALTLLIGVILSMFTAIVIVRLLMNLAVNAGFLSKPSLFRVKRG
ncbi:protein translocase subunit SecD [Clostridium folliculivorans]|uniref:Protein translocase subunit SecD n=1 Tax=Clostridium folliculivorans TaxID=2886038 RepID=A0A9W6D978_9CLOT|nr:protein translocase subunit SecD [Clostridium folliculivorans]GKU23849.1 protein translocase subunit SecD [Clostridium folliculivorans]GKU29965.1 protein translocase subunit SecD [Clostridium folliculivorans]